MSYLADIDLIAEKNEVDAFLAKCLEIEPREVPPVSAAAVSRGPDSGEAAIAPVEPVPESKTEPLEKLETVFAEGPSLKQPDAEIPSGADLAAERAPVGEAAGYSDVKPGSVDVPPETQPEIEIPQTHLGPSDELDQIHPKVVEEDSTGLQPQAAAPITDKETKLEVAPAEADVKPEVMPDLPPAELRSPYLDDKSSLRKPSKNVAAESYAQESEGTKKRLFAFIGIVAALLIGIAVYFFVFEGSGEKPPEIISGKPNTSTSGPEQGKAKADQIHKKITRDGKNESK